MSADLNDLLNDLPPARQAKIAALAEQKIQETIAHATTLSDFRKAMGKTQAEVARELGINQNAVSQLEQRSDTYVSTLRRFLKSLDLSLELSVVGKNGVRIDLPHFLRRDDAAEIPENAVDTPTDAPALASNKRPGKPAPARQ